MIRPALLLAFLVATPSFAADDEKPMYEVRVLHCDEEKGLCVVPAVDIKMAIAIGNAGHARAEKAEAELAKLKGIKGCAKLDVTEPPKSLSPDFKLDPKTLKRG